MRRIHLADPDASRQLAILREQLSAQGNVVSPAGRELTIKVFGEPLPPLRVVERICDDVRQRGLAAVLQFTEQLDQVHLQQETVRVSTEELTAAHAQADAAFLALIRRVRQNLVGFQERVLHRDAAMTVTGLHELRLRYRPMRRVGICIPGGAAAYPSTILMTVCPALVAGVKEIAVVMPPSRFAANNPDMLATCRELGVSEVYRIGGAQAVAALAYGVEGIAAVDMIAGPGNLFVTLAKRHVFGKVAIDMLAGPSEVVVIADGTARADFVAADLVAQAEHSPGASLLISWHAALLDEVAQAIEMQLDRLPRGGLARDCLENFGALVLAQDAREAAAAVNQIAPEHVHIQTREPDLLAEEIDNAGAIFLGHHTPVAVGDYVAGPSHVLPTGGTARFASGLTANDFLRRSSILSFTSKGLQQIAGDIMQLAEKEGLTGHSASVDIRLKDSQ